MFHEEEIKGCETNCGYSDICTLDEKKNDLTGNFVRMIS